MSSKSSVSPAVIVAVVAVLVLVIALVGWKTFGGGHGDRVPVDVNTVKAQLQQNGGIGRR